jgi:MerC mercury resistance protein
MKFINIPRNSNNIGIINSSICLLHCIATPILIGLGASFLTHPIFTYLFIVIAILSAFMATKKTQSLYIKAALWIGVIGFGACLLLEDAWKGFEYLGYAFSLAIIVTHIINRKHCKKCEV